LGAAAGLYEQAGVLYAAAGLHSVVRELEQRQRRVITEGERLLRSVDWDGPSGEQMIGQLAIRDSWPLKFLGDQGRLVLLRVAERRTAQYALSVLVADPTTTERALQIVASRPAVQQLEVLDTLDLDNPWFRERLANSTGAARLLSGHRVSLALAQRWRDCDLARLRAMAEREVGSQGLGNEWLAPIVVSLATRAVATRCDGPELPRRLIDYARAELPTQAMKVKNELKLIQTMR
jgi:hypothetical protein